MLKKKILEKKLYKCNSYHNKYSVNNIANFEKNEMIKETWKGTINKFLKMFNTELSL